MDDDWTVEIILKILEKDIDIFRGWLYEINGGNSVELFSGFFEVKVKGDVVLPEIFHFEEGWIDLVIEVIED